MSFKFFNIQGCFRLQLDIVLLEFFHRPALVTVCVQRKAFHRQRREQANAGDADHDLPNDSNALRKCLAHLALGGLRQCGDGRDDRVGDGDTFGELRDKVGR